MDEIYFDQPDVVSPKKLTILKQPKKYSDLLSNFREAYKIPYVEYYSPKRAMILTIKKNSK